MAKKARGQMVDQKLVELAAQMGIEISEKQAQQLYNYQALLLEWNQKMNLTAIIDPDEIRMKHFLDSLSLISLNPQGPLVDVGTGAGFPGLVIKIMRPDIEVVLLDSLKKRLNFLDAVISDLGLSGISTLHGRAEELGHMDKHRERYQTVTARGVAAMSVLFELCLPLVSVGGVMLAMKGPMAAQELSDAAKAEKVLGGESKVVEAQIPESDMTRHIIMTRKCRHSPSNYPRSHGKIKSSPIK